MSTAEMSREARRSLSAEDLSRLHALILDHVRRKRTHGATCDEAERELGIIHQTLASRVLELRQKGLLVDSGQRRLTSHTRRAVVWVYREYAPGVRP